MFRSLKRWVAVAVSIGLLAFTPIEVRGFGSALSQAALLGTYNAGTSAVSIVFNGQSAVNTTAGTSFTFNSVATGTTGSRSVIIVALCSRATNVLVSGASIDGNAMTSIVATASATQGAAIFALNYNTASSSTVVLTTSASTQECTIGSYSAYNLLSITPDGTGATSGNSSAALAFSITTAASGVAVGGADYRNTTPGTPGGSIAPADFNAASSTATYMGGSQLTTGASATNTYAGGSGNLTGVIASFH